jgi:hypothetical protein
MGSGYSVVMRDYSVVRSALRWISSDGMRLGDCDGVCWAVCRSLLGSGQRSNGRGKGVVSWAAWLGLGVSEGFCLERRLREKGLSSSNYGRWRDRCMRSSTRCETMSAGRGLRVMDRL